MLSNWLKVAIFIKDKSDRKIINITSDWEAEIQQTTSQVQYIVLCKKLNILQA